MQGTIQSCLTALEMSSIQVEAWDCLLVYMVSSKLLKLTLSMWEQSIHNKAEIPTWKELDSFLTERHRTAEAIDDFRPDGPVQGTSRPSNANGPSRRLNAYETRVASAPKGCDLCSRENHPVRLCPRFLEMDVNGRSDYIKRKQLCLNCCARGHQQKDCTSPHSCFTCHSRHHPCYIAAILLQVPPPLQQLCLNCFARGHQLRDCTSTHSCFTCRGRHHTLLHRGFPSSLNTSSSNARTTSSPTTAPSTQPSSRPSSLNVSASTSTVQNYFASGTTAVLLRTAIIDVCHLDTSYRARALFDSGSEATFISERMFNLFKLPFQKIQTQDSGLNQSVSAESTRLCQFAIRSPTKPDPNFFESSQIDILIGADILPSVMMQGTRRNICGSLLGQETFFGWVLTGPISYTKANRVASFTTQVHHKNEDSLDSLLSKFWEVEDLPLQMVKESDSYCERNFLQTTKRDASGRYVVTLPFCDPENSGSDLGYSSPSANGISLNDILHAGPVLQSDLTIQILKWRYFRYVFSADI
ncbi:hypothetical protein KR032_004485, partial [Drosophila birchii]